MATTHPAARGRKCILKHQTFDARDYHSDFDNPELLKSVRLAPSFSLRGQMKSVLDQGDTGACTAHAAASSIMYQLGTDVVPSRLLMYYATRVFVRNIPPKSDTGGTMRDVCIAVKRYNACDEALHPYTLDIGAAPRPGVYAPSNDLIKGNISFYSPIKSVFGLKSELARGRPILFGANLYESFMTDEVGTTGIVPIPNVSSEAEVGGHALLIVGYDDATQKFEVMNSWSDQWGDKGFAYMPYSYVLNPELCDDFWVLLISE